ncbi:unnamed protein product, partial [Enterobius vermicularis]|uniref:17S U2 SnRNP complex component HTATSF1 n=1 Tax=Enterobius vermicularis TaxID=51028 RepID=A0A0N4V0Z4_ENTVE
CNIFSEVERRFIDGKWFCEDGNGGYFVYEQDEWKQFEGGDMNEKWEKAKPINPNRCVIDGVNEDFLALYHANYGIKYDFGSSEGTSTSDDKPSAKEHEGEKAQGYFAGWINFDESQISSVYVSNLPTDITEEMFVDLMSKCGVIQRDPRTNKLKIKLYKDAEGNLKGDATCCYIKKGSVDLALKILDGWDINGREIHVEKAKYEMKGEFDPSKKRKRLTAAQKKKFLENQQRIFEWKPEKSRNYRPISDCTIIMKNMFTVEEMMKNAALVMDLEEEIRKVCERFGKVKKIRVYDNNPEGVISATFENVEQSDLAVKSLNGRVVDGRCINVALWDGKTKYYIVETEEQKQARLAEWQKHIGEGSED